MIPRTVLVTRAAEQAGATARRLRERGHIPVIAPLVRIEQLSAVIESDAQAILVTSRNGAAALAAVNTVRTTTVLAVGDATAADLRGVGYANVHSAGGDAEALAHLAVRLLDPSNGPVVHARGAEIRHSPLAFLRQAGFQTIESILYRTLPIDTLPDTATACDTTLVYSPGSGTRLAKAASHAARFHIIGISQAALTPLSSHPCAISLHAAPHPTEDAMLTLLDALPE